VPDCRTLPQPNTELHLRGPAGEHQVNGSDNIIGTYSVLAELEAAGLITLADKGYQGSAYAKIPYRGRNKPESQKEANPRPRETPRTRRARERPAQNVAHPPQAPLLPLARRTTRQGHSRIAGPRGITRMEKVHCLASRPLPSLDKCQVERVLPQRNGRILR
jgi:hypothetical protein